MSSDWQQGNWRNIYIHIPFCASKCGYCAFYSETAAGTDLRQRYLKSVIGLLQQREFPEPVQTVYLGGGTPNFLTAQELAWLFEHVRKYVPLSCECEISCELNPECLTANKMSVLNEHVTRLSLGVQSFDAAVRRKLMRKCDETMLQNALKLLMKRRAKHFNIDLIYGVAGVSWACFEQDLRSALDCGVDHLSCYALTAEENSRLGLSSPVADDHSSAEWWLKIGRTLSANGLERYEISNYARPGGECRHNINVWRGDTLLGIGAAAAGYNGRDRYTFEADVNKFIAGTAPEVDELDQVSRALEIFAVNLRTTSGWRRCEWEALYPGSWDKIVNLSKKTSSLHPQWWVVNADNIKLTVDGLLFWDDAAMDVLDWIDEFEL